MKRRSGGVHSAQVRAVETSVLEHLATQLSKLRGADLVRR